MEELIDSVSNFNPLIMMGLGLLIGIQHAFEPDHVAAIGTQFLAKKSKSGFKNTLKSSFTKSSLVGIFWGTGHTTTLMIVGYLTFSLAITLQDEILSGFELMVGAMLIILGLSSLWRKKFKFRHRHPHHHSDGKLYNDFHDHIDVNHKHDHKPYFIGMIHGLAGSGSLIAFTATTIDNMEMGLVFIIIFGLGSILGMVVGGFLGLPFLINSRFIPINKIFRYVISVVCLAIGAKILLDVSLSGNLLF